VYCRRAWWLKRGRGLTSQHTRQLRAGSTYHEQHGRQVQSATWLRRAALVLLFVALSLGAFLIVTGG
jgi:hypothetical protein